MELIERIGTYLGFAAFFGLAVLALLYFSQARDVRRLRDWAGRAPERAAAAAEQASTTYAQQAEAYRRERPRPMRRLPEARYLLLIAGGAIILGVGAIVGVNQLLSGGDGGGGSKPKQEGGKGPIIPSKVEVAVLNGTAVPGLAAKVGDDVEAQGFKLGAVTNTTSTFDVTTAMYDRGRKREAKAVAEGLGVDRVKVMTPDVKSAARGAPVAVVVGADREA